MRIPQISSVPVPPSCTYNISSESVFFDGSDACNRVLPPANVQPVQQPVGITTSRDFSKCLMHFNSTVCEMEQLCSQSEQLSCLLQICEVAADSNVGQNQTNLDVYTACFTAVFRSLSTPPEMTPQMSSNMPPDLTLILITTVTWFQYCLDDTGDYELCVYIIFEVCFSGDLLGSITQCLMALPVVCEIFEFDQELQQECAITVEMVLRVTLPSMCGQSGNVQTCVSS